ncbi:MAG: DsbA family oxidoreductase [Leptospirillum sp.]|jgi:predicted DsbA family dithiol-disulfide isomerase
MTDEAFNPEKLIDVQWYTDPLCSWSFAAEKAMGDFRNKMGNRIIFHHRMLPLYQLLDTFLAAHEMKTPADFASKIRKASKATGVEMTTTPWEKGIVPKDGSILSKWALAALSIDPVKGDQYLHHLRRAFFVEGRDLTKTGSLRDLGGKVGLDPEMLEKLSSGEMIRQQLESDIKKGAEEGVSVRPTLVMVNSGGDRIFIGGLRDAELFIHAAEVLISEA